MQEELTIARTAFKGDTDDYASIREAIDRLSNASQEQFETIKKEKWFNRVFDMVTFSKKNEIRLAEQVGTLAQAQEIFIELLLRLSSNDAMISQMICESMENIRKLQEQDMYLLERINKLENISLGIKPDMDISSLTDKNKQILSGCLYYISKKNTVASDAQKKYANAVLSYINTDIQMDNPMLALDEMDLDSKRKILACCMEYMFLKDFTAVVFDEYEDFIEEFDFGNKTINSVKKQIENVYHLRGVDFFYSKYTLLEFDDLDDFFEIEFDDEIGVQEEEAEEMTDEYIRSIIQISPDEKKIYKYKNIHISAYVDCKGQIEIDHCVLYYNDSNTGDKISLDDGAGITIKNSTVICKGFDESSFIKCKGNNDVIFENTSFKDCSFFINTVPFSEIRFRMEKCEIKNCYENFINVSAERDYLCKISDTLICIDELSSFHLKNRKHTAKLIHIYGKLKFYNNLVSQSNSFRRFGLDENDRHDNELIVLDCHDGDVLNSTFIGLTQYIFGKRFCECKFEKCVKPILLSSSKTSVDNCVFVNCMGEIIRCEEETRIVNCQFISCNDKIIEGNLFGGNQIEFCEFINIKNQPQISSWFNDEESFVVRYCSCIVFNRKSRDAKANYLKNCIFNGVDLQNTFLVASTNTEKKYGTVAYIEDCSFTNCMTDFSSKEIIGKYIYYDELFSKNQKFQAIQISNCKGLDRTNKEGSNTENFEIKAVSSAGNIIGSTITKQS